MTDIQEVLREMRLYADENNYGPDVGRWLIAIEAGIREPVAYISHTSQGDVLDWEPQFDAPSHIKLYAFPPDAQAEIAVLREDKERLMDRIDGCHQAMRKKDAEIERLWALFSHWYEMWNDGIPNPDGDVLDDTAAALAGKEDG